MREGAHNLGYTHTHCLWCGINDWSILPCYAPHRPQDHHRLLPAHPPSLRHPAKGSEGWGSSLCSQGPMALRRQTVGMVSLTPRRQPYASTAYDGAVPSAWWVTLQPRRPRAAVPDAAVAVVTSASAIGPARPHDAAPCAPGEGTARPPAPPPDSGRANPGADSRA